MISTGISVIMPAYNAGLFIKESIDSVIAQTYPNWELIIVDDGSKDNTKQIVDDYVKKDNRIKYTYQQNGKQGKARNTGIEKSQSDFIAFLDADDVWMPEMLTKQVLLLEESNCDLVFSSVEFINEESEVIKGGLFVKQKIYKNLDGLKELLKSNCIPISTVVAKKKSINQVNGFKTSSILQFGEDYDLWLRMLISDSCFACNPQPLAFYRWSSSQSSKLTSTKYLQLLAIIKSLPLGNHKKEKNKAIHTWFRRSIKHSNFKNHSSIRNLLQYLPSSFLRKLSMFASYFLPVKLLKQTVIKLSYMADA